MAKDGKKAGIVGTMLGMALIVGSYLIFLYSKNEYLLSIQSEMAGAGIILTLLGFIYMFFKLRIRG